MKQLFFLLCIIFSGTNLLAKTVEPIEMTQISMFRNTVKISVPKIFKGQTKEQINGYKLGTSNAELQYLDDSKTVSITFYADNLPADDRTLPAVTHIMEKVLRQMHPKAKWKNTGVENITGGKVGFVEYHNKKPEKYFELVFFTEFRGQLLSCVFHAPKKGYKAWKTVSYDVMRSLVLINEKE